MFIHWCKKIRLSSLTQDYFRCHWAQCYRFSTTWTSQASFHVRQKLNKWTSSWWDNFVCVTVIEEEWQENSCMSQTSLYKLADKLRVTLDKYGRANWIWKWYLWMWKFLNPQGQFCGFKNIRICLDGTLYIDDCHTGEHSQLIGHCRHQHCHIPTSECEQSNEFFSYISAS